MTFSVWGSLLVAIALWSGFGVMVWQLGVVRMNVATHEEDMRMSDEKNRVTAQLQTLMRDTRDQRAALARLSSIDALAAAATIEASGKKAGTIVSISSAVSDQVNEETSGTLRAVTFVVNTEGEFPRLLHVAQLFETLPFPSHVENYEFFSLDPAKGQKDPWRMSARIRAIIPDTQ